MVAESIWSSEQFTKPDSLVCHNPMELTLYQLGVERHCYAINHVTLIALINQHLS